MSAQHLLKQGVAIIANCQQQTGDIWDAHYGAACIGAYFLTQSPILTTDVAQAISYQAEQMSSQHSLITELPVSNTLISIDAEEAETMIVQALAHNIDQLHWVGHNVIYSAVSLLAIRELTKWEHREDIQHIQQLISSFDRTIPGRSWIGYRASEVKKVIITEEDQFPAILTPADLSALVLQELAQCSPIYRAEAHHDLIGHMLTFSHALNILYDLGQVPLFIRGVVPLLQMIKVLRYSRNLDEHAMQSVKLYSPVDHLPLERAVPVPFSYTDIQFWQQNLAMVDWDYGHHFKFVWSYNDHIQRAPLWSEATDIPFRCLINGLKEE